VKYSISLDKDMPWRIQEFLKGLGVGAIEARGWREAVEFLHVKYIF
jgi:hypothetical protein